MLKSDPSSGVGPARTLLGGPASVCKRDQPFPNKHLHEGPGHPASFPKNKTCPPATGRTSALGRTTGME